MLGTKKSLAINFSDNSLEAVELTFHHGKYSVHSYARALLDSGTIVDGKILLADKLRESVKKLLASAKPQPITSTDVVFTLPESKVFAHVFELPKSLDRKQIPNALLSQARETIPLDISLMAFDYLPTAKHGDLNEYLFVATYKDLLQEYVTFFQSLRMKIKLATMESVALAAASIAAADDHVVLLLDIGARTTIASIFQAGQLQETININIAGDKITASIAEKLKLSTEEAETRKIAAGLRSQTNGGSEMLIIQGQIQPLKDELLLFVKYFEQKANTMVDQVLLTGGTAAMAGLDEYFASNLGLPVAIAQPSPQFDVHMDLQDMTKFLVAIGSARLGIDDHAKGLVNFLSYKEKQWAAPRTALRAGLRSNKAVRDAAEKPSMKRRTKELVALIILLVLAANFFAWAWIFNHRSGAGIPVPEESSATAAGIVPALQRTFQFIIEPFKGAKKLVVSEKIVSFDFTAALDPKTAQAADMRAHTENFEVEQDVSYDEGNVLALTKQLQATLNADPSPEQFDAALGEFLADQLWLDYSPEVIKNNDANKKVLLPSYVSKKLNSMQKDASTQDSAIHKAKIIVSYTGLIIDDKDKFTKLEADRLALFQKANPEFSLQAKSFRFDESLGNSRIRVEEILTFDTQ